MKKKEILLLGLIVLMMLSSFSRLTDIIEDFKARVSGYYNEKIESILFLHTDKSIYIPNERIWFKAYLLDSSPLQHEVLYLRLINDQQQIVLQQQFLVYDIRANGDMLIPINITPGQYKLIAYTDKMISFNPENVFVQQIQVIKDQSFDINAEASVADSSDFSAGKMPEIIVKVSADNHEIEKAKGTYKIYTADKKTIIEGKFVTGSGGITTLRFLYPAIAKNEDLFLQCKITAKDQSKELNIRLPKTKESVTAHFYPEGGNLVNGISNRVLIVLADDNGKPLTAKIVLKNKTRQVAATSTNTNGLAVITFTPDLKEQYSLAIHNARNLHTIAFPVKIDPAGYVIQLTGTPAQPMIMVKNQNMQGNIFLAGRTLSELKLSMALNLKSGDSILISLPRNDSVNHVIDLGLFDAQNKLLAERLVYLPVAEKYHITFHLDQTGYAPRQKVRAGIMVTDANGNSVPANLSVAVVAQQTLHPSALKKITETDLNTLRHYRPNSKDINDLNDELMRENIRTGDWADVMNYQPKGQIKMFSNAAGIFGSVINKKKKKIDLKTLYLYNKSVMTTVPVNANGTFSIAPKDLVTQTGENNYLIVNEDFNEKYELQINNYPANFDAKFIMASLPDNIPYYDQIKNSVQLSSITAGRILREVVIKGKNTKSSSFSLEDVKVINYYSVDCRDYVCYNSILNCKIHRDGGTPPEEGRLYVIAGHWVRYHGCASNKEPKNNSYKVKSIGSPHIFYLPDYINQPVSAPELQSTIFWEPNLNTRTDGKSTIEFYTSDIKGAFTIVVQGLTVNSLVPVFGKSNFTVLQKKTSDK